MSSWTLETLITTPPFSSVRNRLIASRAHRNDPRRSTASTRSNSSPGSCSDGREIWMPALLIRMSRPPRRSPAWRTIRTDVLLGGDVSSDEEVADPVLAHPPQAGVHLLLGAGRL